MYKLSKTNSDFDVMFAIDGNDIYNSKFIYDMDQIENTFTAHNLYYKGRLDLVSENIYKTSEPVPYEVIALLNRIHQTDTSEYKDLSYIPEIQIRKLKLG